MAGSRHAALALHALAPSERSWMLERLAPGQRALLQAHLDELSALGIPPDRRLLDEALRQAQAQASSRAVLVNATVDVMQSVLASEPPGVLARVLALAPWPWADEMTSRLEPQQRRRVEALRPVAQASRPALDEWLLDELAQRVQGVMPVSEARETPAESAPWWRSLLQRWKVAR